jgi:hypothetical protein
LVSEELLPRSGDPTRKSKPLAVLLCLIFGPLGLIYVGGWWQAFVMIAVGLPMMLTHKFGLWLFIGARVIAAGWAYSLAVEQDGSPNSERDAGRLLDQASRLESADFHQAIAAYEEVMRLYPNTRASNQAASAIATLKRHG